MKISAVILTGAVMTALAAPAAAACASPRIYPASWCKYGSYQGNDVYLTTGGGNATGIKNTDSVAHTVICPVLRTYGNGFYQTVLNVDGTSWSTLNVELRATSWDGKTEYVAPTPVLNEYSAKSTSEFIWGSFVPPSNATAALYISARAQQWVRKYELLECSGL